MKKYFNLLLMAALVCGLSMGITSCSDKDDAGDNASAIEIDKDITTRGVETDMQSAVIEVPVKCNGHWTATLKKGTTWARILEWQVAYDGPKTLRIAIDENLSKADRRTTLNIGNSDGELTKIEVRQYYNFEGQPPTNGSGQAFADKGLGTGIDYDYVLNMKNVANANSEFDATKVHHLNNLFNMTVIDDLMKRNKLQKSAYVESVIPIANLMANLMDSSLVQNKYLGTSLTLSVEFGPISFTGHGKYGSKKEESRAIVDYTIVRNCPMYNAYVSPAELASFAEDPKNNHVDFDAEDAAWQQIDDEIEFYLSRNKRRRGLEVNDRGLTEEQEEIIEAMEDAAAVYYDYGGVFSSGFTGRCNELRAAITKMIQRKKPIDTKKADATLNAIDNEYGPFFIAGGDYGGAMIMHCDIDTMALAGRDTLSGEMSAEFAGMFEVEGSFYYTTEGYTLLRNSNTRIYIYGGNANETADKMLGFITGGNATDLNKWQGTMKDWISSMYSPAGNEPKLSEAAPISYTITPIWTLFRDPDVQEYVQNYFLKKYASRGINAYFGIMNGTVAPPGFGELVDPNSDFWSQSGSSWQ
ncbi:MAG: hypothetical protein J6W75_03855 [Bacteroidaceae bacterium]|nr:hypothetical protein [Bacteroidaceae bacterium]